MPLRFEGMGQVADALEALKLDPDSFRGAIENAAQPILEQMQANAASHRISGALAGALGVKPSEKGATIGVHRSDWSGDEYYPAYVEFGHGGPHPASAHPIIRPAVDARGEEAVDRLVNEIRQRLK